MCCPDIGIRLLSTCSVVGIDQMQGLGNIETLCIVLFLKHSTILLKMISVTNRK